MDLARVFAGTLSPEEEVRKAAENSLHAVCESAGFVSAILQLVTTEGVEIPVQQAAAVFLKNFMFRSWEDRKIEGQHLISEDDKQVARDNILQCMIVAPDATRRILREVVSRMIDDKFPSHFPGFAEKMLAGFSPENERVLSGSLIVFYQITKKHSMKKLDERVEYDQILQVAVHRMLEIANSCLAQPTPEALLILKLIVKIFCSAVMYVMPAFMLDREIFAAWMGVFVKVLSMQVETPSDGDQDEWPNRPVWKLKKWTCRTLHKLFQRYGTVSQAQEEYKSFAEVFSREYSAGVLEIMWNSIKQYRAGAYMSPRVVTEILRYIENALEPSQTWKMLKPLVPEIISDILLPLMSFNESDALLWDEDPQEFVRKKYDPFLTAHTPDVEAAVFLKDLVTVRGKNTIDIAFQFVYQTLAADKAAEPATRNPHRKDGALHMTAVLGETLMERKKYKKHLEQMMVEHVFPEFTSPHGFLRARACQVFHTYSKVDFQSMDNIMMALDLILKCLRDADLPVRIQGAIALRSFLIDQHLAKRAVQPIVKDLVQTLLTLMQEAESDDLACVLGRLIELFSDDVLPFAVDLVRALLTQFNFLFQALQQDTVESDENVQRAMAAMGIMQSVASVLELRDREPKLSAPCEELVCPVLENIFDEGVMDYIEEALELMQVMSSGPSISNRLWKLFTHMYHAFKRELVDYFPEMCPIVYQYIRFGLSAVGGHPDAAEMHRMVFDMVQTIWNRPGDDERWHAGKIMENCMTWCPGVIDDYVQGYVGLAVTKLLGDDNQGSQLQIMCMNIVLTALRYNPLLLIKTMDSVGDGKGEESLLCKFLALWFTRVQDFKGIHNRKLGILALSTLLDLPYKAFPPHIQRVWPHILRTAFVLFEKLPLAYKLRAQEDEEDEEDDEIEGDEGDMDDDGAGGTVGEADDDDDYYDPADALSPEDMEQLRLLGNIEFEGDDDELDLGQFQNFPTLWDDDDTIDEYGVFVQALTSLQQDQPPSYTAVMSQLNADEAAKLTALHELAHRRAEARRSKALAESGGYNFTP
eukprot:m.298645 g.298645  ORF g.298645 m.298645 type:complete len:1040 (-) comp20094_c0_seq2:338-3457(-)